LTTAGALVSLAVERSRLEAATARALAAEERNRLAREIHDTLAQGLAALTMQLEVADSLASPSSENDARLRSAVARALMLARSTLDQARASVLDLREAPLEGRTLRDALGIMAADAGSASAGRVGIAIVAEPDADAGLTAAVAGGLYRIAQQAVVNAMRHADARRIIVRLMRSERAVRLRVEDDGTGFEPTQVPSDRFGLVGMRERARLLGGALTVESGPDAGTAIEVVVPMIVRPPGASRERR
jgi:two-component system NarL family sensor kinase